MKILLFLLTFLLICTNSFAQNDIGLNWQKTYGGSGEDLMWSIKQTTDGGYIVAGKTMSTDGDITGYHGGPSDYWVVKTDQSGNIQWEKTYGGSGDDRAIDIQVTADGSYIIAGFSDSNDGDVTGNHGSYDYWIVKTDQTGTIRWQKCYGGFNTDMECQVQLTIDGGYIIAGTSYSNNGDVTGNHGQSDYWVVKTDSSGTIQWQKSYGGSWYEYFGNIRQTIDGGYIISGSSSSNDGDVTGNHGADDYWVVKIDSSGTIQWQKSYGGSNNDGGYCIQQTIDGGYIIAGTTSSIDGDVTGNHGGMDYWIVKTDQTGTIQWQKCYGGSYDDVGLSINQLTDGGYLIAGLSTSNDGDVTGNHGWNDYWVVKTDLSGIIQWQKCYGGSGDDRAIDIQVTADGSYIIAGFSDSNDGDVTGNHGSYDYWIVKLCQGDPLVVSISDTSYCYSTFLTATTGFANYLWNTGDTTQTIEVDTSGVYSVRATNLAGCPSEKTITVPAPIQPYSGEQICMVTLDSLSGKNVIVIEKTLNVGTDSLHIYRLDNLSSLYKQIGSLGINEPGIFTDIDAIPAQQSYQYKISVKDTCGKESGLSAKHRTILLQANTGINHEVNLFWNPYEGFEYSTFEIYRKNISRDGFLLIANVPNTTYAFTDLTPPSGTNLYQVRVSKDSPCVPTKSSYSHVSSNVITSGNIGIDENQELSFTIHPNPASDKLTVNIQAQWVGLIYTITDQTGRVLLTGNLTSEVSNINISKLSPGIYLFKLGEQNKRIVKIIKN
jgi:Secretion system C-terminal sorting domain